MLPRMKGFFQARTLDSEAQRFLGLTHLGQSRAISDGVPMVLWINPQGRTYGLEPQAGYGAPNASVEQVTVDPTLRMRIEMTGGLMTQSNLWTQIRKPSNRMEIRFLPDGTIAESSPNRISISQGPQDTLWITEATNHLRYEIHRE